MTDIKITQSGNVLCFSCMGHACQAEKGKDIVCAGISALCIALLERIKELENEKYTQIKKCRVSDGCLILHFTLTEKTSECYKTVFGGFKFIAETYPDNCRISESV